MIHKKGEILLLSSGEYSNYSVVLTAKVLKDFDEKEVVKSYLKSWSGIDFPVYLINEKYIKEIYTIEWNYMSYGEYQTSEGDDIKGHREAL